MLVGKTDVPPNMSLWQAARKAVVMNISDFVFKGVQPTAALVSLGVPRDVMRKDIEEIARGLNAGAREYGAYVIGGDTVKPRPYHFRFTLRNSRKIRPMLRNGASQVRFSCDRVLW